MGNSIIEDLVDLVDQTPGWRYEPKAGTGGYIVYPKRAPGIPEEYLRPIHLPRKIADGIGTHSDNYTAALKRAGLPIGKDARKTELTVVDKSDLSPPPARIDLFELAKSQIATAIDALSGLEVTLNKIKAEGADAERLRDTLKGLLGGK